MKTEDTLLRAIVAMGRNNEIGLRGGMPWHLPEDLRHFKETTMGHPVIMGRATWESIPRRPLPGRRNIVLSRNPEFAPEGAEVFGSVAEALAACRGEQPMVIGGAAVYAQAMPLVGEVLVTRIDAPFPEADRLFPNLHVCDWTLADHSDWLTSSTGLRYRFERYTRR